MPRIVLAIAVAALAASTLAFPRPVTAQAGPQARVWVDGDRDYFRRGDRLRVRFSSNVDAYVAVIHIDTDGTLDFLYPRSPWDDGYVRGGHVYSAPQSGRYSSLSVRGRSGIGYVYVIASDEPLDFSYFGGPYRGSWDWSFAGRHVRGDPYLALEQITRMLVPGWSYGGYSVDYYSYHVDRRHHYPSYACGTNRWGVDRGWGWTPHYGSCDRLVVFLRRYPGYYDTHRYRGDRRVYLRGAPLPEVRHGYKAPARAQSGSGMARPSARGSESAGADRSSTVRQPARQRPTLERRGADGRASPPTTSPRSRESMGEAVERPRPAARPRTGGSTRPAATPRSGTGGSTRPAATPRSGNGGSTRPAATPRSGNGGSTRPAATPRSGNGGSTRPAATPRSGNGGSTRPAATPRSSNGGSSRPAARPSQPRSGGGSSRPAARPATRGSGGGSAPARASTPRSSSGSSSGSEPARGSRRDGG